MPSKTDEPTYQDHSGPAPTGVFGGFSIDIDLEPIDPDLGEVHIIQACTACPPTRAPDVGEEHTCDSCGRTWTGRVAWQSEPTGVTFDL